MAAHTPATQEVNMRLATIIFLALTICTRAADRITLTLQFTANPTNGQTLVVNGSTRTWTNAVSAPSTQVLTGSDGQNAATNLYSHFLTAPFTGPLVPVWVSTNTLRLVGQVGQAMSGTATAWGTVTYTTQTVSQATVVRVPFSSEPTASVRTNSATQLVADLFNNGLSTTVIAASSPPLANFVDTSENQTIAGNKTFSGAVVTGNAGNIWNSGQLTNASFGNLRSAYYLTNNGIMFFSSGGADPSYAVAPDSTGKPSLYTVTINGSAERVLGTLIPYSPADNNLLTFSVASNKFGMLTNAQTWTSTNTFTLLTGTSTNLVNRGPLQSYKTDDTSVIIGKTARADAANGGGTAVGYQSAADGDESIAIGFNAATEEPTAGHDANYAIAIGSFAEATNNASVAIGYLARTTLSGQVRLGTDSHYVSIPGIIRIDDNVVVGTSEAYTSPASLDNGIVIIDGTASTADPATGVAEWSLSGALQYRSSAANEGSGKSHYFHNRDVTAVGSGSNFSVAGTAYARVDFGGTDPEIVLPTAGTWLISAVASIQNGATANDVYSIKLFNSTDASDVANSEQTISSINASLIAPLVIINIPVTVTTGKTIQMYGRNATAARGTFISTATRLTAVRLY